MIEKVIKEDVEPYLDDLSSEKNVKNKGIDDLLTKIDIHYSKRKPNVPLMRNTETLHHHKLCGSR